MDILLFNQYFTSEKELPDTIFSTLPLNLLHLGSYLKREGLDCKFYELGAFDISQIRAENDRIRCGLSNQEIVRIIDRESPKVIGLGCMYSRHYIDVIAIAKLIKKTNPLIKIILGGNHATAFCDMVLREPFFDFIVRGEGEITFYELCREILAGGKDFSSINGLAYKDSNGEIIKTKPRQLVKDLDELPLDYSFIDVKRYADISRGSPFLMRYPATGIISSRGCPGECVYCTVKAVWGRTWRAKTAKRTVDEMELLNCKYGIKEFAFLDDSASLDKKRWSNICDEIIKRDLDIRWTTPNGIAHWTLNKEILEKMKKAGCYRVTFGIESGNIETRKFLGKPFPLSQAKEMIQHANRIGMWTICTNILGFPYEKKKSMDDTVNFAKTSGTDFATFFILAPHVTSDVYQYFKKEGLIDFDFVFRDSEFDKDKYEEMNKILDDRGTPTKYFTSEQIKAIQIKAYRSFIIYRAATFLNPLRILRKIRSAEDFRYTFKLLSRGLKILVNSFFKKTTKTLLYE